MLSAVAETRGEGWWGGVGSHHRTLFSSIWLRLPSSATPHCDPGPSTADSFCFPHLPGEAASEESREVAGEKRGSRRRLKTVAAGKRKGFREQLPPTGAAGRFFGRRRGGTIMDHPFTYSSCFWGACISSGPQGQMPFSPAANLAATFCRSCCFSPPPPPLFFFTLFLTKISPSA